MTNLTTTPPYTCIVAYAGLQKRGEYLRDDTVIDVCPIVHILQVGQVYRSSEMGSAFMAHLTG